MTLLALVAVALVPCYALASAWAIDREVARLEALLGPVSAWSA